MTEDASNSPKELIANSIELTEKQTEDAETISASSVIDGIELGDNYEVLELVGQGGMGHVYKVRDKSLDRIFAVKVLRKDLIVDKQSVKRFTQEASAAAGLTHENVVSVYSHGEAKDGSPFITMNYIEGESLAAILKREGALDWRRVANLFTQICNGLEHAHANGIVHRDLKPSNIIISKDPTGLIETAYIVDFGIAKLLTSSGDTLTTLTGNSDFLGTPMYMSPEQCLGQTLDPRTDIYSLGCMLFEALDGKGPFAGASPVEVIARKMSEDSPALTTTRIPPQLSLMASCCMARHPQDRYDSVRAIIQDLNALARDSRPSEAPLKSGLEPKMLGKRFAAAAIDWIIVTSVTGFANLFSVFIIGMIAAVVTGGNEFAAGFALAMGYFVFPFILWIGYFAYFEHVRGMTPGKQLLGLSVCDLYGKKITVKQSILRNVVKSVVVAIAILIPVGMVGTVIKPEPAIMLGTGILFVFAVILSRIIRISRQLPWDLWTKTQIRRR